MAVLIHSASIVECLLYTRLHDWRWRFRNEQNTVCPQGEYKSPTHQPSSCKILKMQTCFCMSSHRRHKWNCSLLFVSYCWQYCSSTISHLSCLFPWCQPLYANLHTVLPYFSRYTTIRLKMFFVLCTVGYLGYLWWVPLLDLQTNSIYKGALGTFLCTGLAVKQSGGGRRIMTKRYIITNCGKSFKRSDRDMRP